MLDLIALASNPDGRSPHGERGLKYGAAGPGSAVPGSLPARGAWVEIRKTRMVTTLASGRSPHGERGLKSSAGPTPVNASSRSPHGERGLKSV